MTTMKTTSTTTMATTRKGGADSEDAARGISTRSACGVTFNGDDAMHLFNAKLVSQRNDEEDGDEEPRPRGCGINQPHSDPDRGWN